MRVIINLLEEMSTLMKLRKTPHPLAYTPLWLLSLTIHPFKIKDPQQMTAALSNKLPLRGTMVTIRDTEWLDLNFATTWNLHKSWVAIRFNRMQLSVAI